MTYVYNYTKSKFSIIKGRFLIDTRQIFALDYVECSSDGSQRKVRHNVANFTVKIVHSYKDFLFQKNSSFFSLFMV